MQKNKYLDKRAGGAKSSFSVREGAKTPPNIQEGAKALPGTREGVKTLPDVQEGVKVPSDTREGAKSSSDTREGVKSSSDTREGRKEGKKHYEQSEIFCPYYKRHENGDGYRITCEGLNNGSTLSLSFNSPRVRGEYSERMCKSPQGCKKCLIYRALNIKYDT